MNDSDCLHVLVHLRLYDREAAAYIKLCEQECRRPAQQARYMILKELRERGLLKSIEAGTKINQVTD